MVLAKLSASIAFAISKFYRVYELPSFREAIELNTTESVVNIQ